MGEEAKSKIMEMPLQQRLKYGYKKVLDMLLVSGGISIVAVLLVYFGAKANIFGAESGTVATFFLVIGLANVIIVGIVATMIAKKISDQVIDSVLEPLQQIEVVAGELVNGNLHSNLEYHSDDEVGKLAHDLRKSIRTLGTYIDDIDQTMRQFADGNFNFKPQVEWKGDFVGIKESIVAFEESMSDTVSGIQRAANEVSNGAEQVAASSSDLAQGATDQASVVEELTATLASVADQVAENAEHAKEISQKVDGLGTEIMDSNGQMHEMVTSMNEINEASQEIGKSSQQSMRLHLRQTFLHSMLLSRQPEQERQEKALQLLQTRLLYLLSRVQMLLRSQQLLLSLQSRLLKKEWLLQARQHRSLRRLQAIPRLSQMRLMESQRHLRHRQMLSSRLIMV